MQLFDLLLKADSIRDDDGDVLTLYDTRKAFGVVSMEYRIKGDLGRYIFLNQEVTLAEDSSVVAYYYGHPEGTPTEIRLRLYQLTPMKLD